MDLQSLQALLARLLTDPHFRASALWEGTQDLSPSLQGVDPSRVEAFARQLAAKRMRALRRTLPLTMAVMGTGATDWIARYVAACLPLEGAPGADGERFAAFVAKGCNAEAGECGTRNAECGMGPSDPSPIPHSEADTLPSWLPDLARYE